MVWKISYHIEFCVEKFWSLNCNIFMFLFIVFQCCRFLNEYLICVLIPLGKIDIPLGKRKFLYTINYVRLFTESNFKNVSVLILFGICILFKNVKSNRQNKEWRHIKTYQRKELQKLTKKWAGRKCSFSHSHFHWAV